jgi:hypothetical protein
MFDAVNVRAQASGERALTQGKNPLRQAEIETMIEFYEWMFESEFTADERERFQEYTIKEFKANPTTGRQTVDEIVKTLPRLRELDSDAQTSIRKGFLNDFVPEMRKGTDENSQMLLEIYERARENGQNVARNDRNANAKNAPRTGKSGNAGGIVGKWFRSTGSGHRDYTGKTQYKAGEDFTFEFFADGTVSYLSELDVLTITQCEIKGTNKARGTYTISGDTLTINLGAMNALKSSTCDKKENYNKTLEPSTITVKFNVKKMESITRPDEPMLLCFDNAGDNDCYEKVNR